MNYKTILYFILVFMVILTILMCGIGNRIDNQTEQIVKQQTRINQKLKVLTLRIRR